MFKEDEPGNKEVNIERSEEALAASPNIIAAGCPFCNTMLTDGVKHFNKEGEVQVKDVAELIAEAVAVDVTFARLAPATTEAPAATSCW